MIGLHTERYISLHKLIYCRNIQRIAYYSKKILIFNGENYVQ